MLALYTNLSVRLRSDEKGATAVEYGIMVALIAVVIIVAVTLLGGTLTDMFEDVDCQIKGGTYDAQAPRVQLPAAAVSSASTCLAVSQHRRVLVVGGPDRPPPRSVATSCPTRGTPCRRHPNAVPSQLSSRFWLPS